MKQDIPNSPEIKKLWEERRKLLKKVSLYGDAIFALQQLCDHTNEVDVSHHGSPDYECPDCGKGMLFK